LGTGRLATGTEGVGGPHR